MFTTGQHLYLGAASGLYTLASVLGMKRGIKPALLVFAAGVVIHGLYLLGRGWLGGVFVANPIFEGPFLLPFLLASVAIASETFRRDRAFPVLAIATAIFCAFSLVYAKGMIPPSSSDRGSKIPGRGALVHFASLTTSVSMPLAVRPS